jgi:hypothetical protein
MEPGRQLTRIALEQERHPRLPTMALTVFRPPTRRPEGQHGLLDGFADADGKLAPKG